MRLLFTTVIVLLAGVAFAQDHQHQHKPSPYAGLQQRAVKALTDQQVADLRAGRGMGLALPAELNGYPGPLHVIELADQLQLTTSQHQRVEQLYAAMSAEAVPIGERLIEQETALDQQFKDHTITPENLAALTARIGETHGMLRAAHLKYHLVTAELLTSEQMHRYAELRGYR